MKIEREVTHLVMHQTLADKILANLRQNIFAVAGSIRALEVGEFHDGDLGRGYRFTLEVNG